MGTKYFSHQRVINIHFPLPGHILQYSIVSIAIRNSVYNFLPRFNKIVLLENLFGGYSLTIFCLLGALL